jgi:membrane protein
MEAQQQRGWRVWYALVKSAVMHTFTDNVPQWAAAIGFYSFFSLFPLILGIVSISAYFVQPEWVIERLSSFLGEVLPKGDEHVREIVEGVMQTRGTVGIVAILTLLWSGSRVFGALTRALNIIFDAKEPFSFFVRLKYELAMTVSFGTLFLLVMLASLAQPFLQESAFAALRIGAAALLVFGIFVALYRYVPRKRLDIRSSLFGATFATGFFLLGRSLFTIYIARFADLNLVYGAVSTIVALLLWAWIAGLITLFGGELASNYEYRIVQRLSEQEIDRRHELRSPVKVETEQEAAAAAQAEEGE